jgi:hypothetical protein
MRRIVLFISLVLLLAISCYRSTDRCEASGDVSIAYLCSLADQRSQRLKGDMWIEGCVVLNDKLGEAYKSFVLYDGTAGVEVEVDVEDVDRVAPLFAELRIRCEGLHVGREGERVVLGAKPTAEYVVDRIPESETENRFEVTLSAVANRHEQSMTIADVGYDDMLRYVRIEGVQLVEEEAGLTWCDMDASERPFDSSLRHFTDGTDTLTVAVLNRCHYAVGHIPSDIVTLVGVVDSYDGCPVLRLSDRRILSEAIPSAE